MKAILIDEKRLDAMRDAMLDKLKVGASERRHAVVGVIDLTVNYRTVHYCVHEFVSAIKDDK